MRLLFVLLMVGCGRIGFASEAAGDGPAGTTTTFAATCSFERLATISHGGAGDDSVATVMADSIASACGTSPARRALSQDTEGVLAGSGRPLTPPDELVVIGGGDGPNRAIAYLLASDTALVWSSTATDVTIRERATGRTIVDEPFDGAHDFAMVFVVREPIGGALVVSAQGMTSEGTLAAGRWFATVLAPELAASADVWAVVEWTAGSSDTFTERARGR